MLKKLKLYGFMKTYKIFKTPKNDALLTIGDWNAKVESQEIPGVQANLALEYKMKQVKG